MSSPIFLSRGMRVAGTNSGLSPRVTPARGSALWEGEGVRKPEADWDLTVPPASVDPDGQRTLYLNPRNTRTLMLAVLALVATEWAAIFAL